MNDDMRLFLNQFDHMVQKRVKTLVQFIKECAPSGIQIESKGAMMIFQKRGSKMTLRVYPDHLNLQAKGIQKWKAQIEDEYLTPRGKLKLYHGKTVPFPLLKLIIQESFR